MEKTPGGQGSREPTFPGGGSGQGRGGLCRGIQFFVAEAKAVPVRGVCTFQERRQHSLGTALSARSNRFSPKGAKGVNYS